MCDCSSQTCIRQCLVGQGLCRDVQSSSSIRAELRRIAHDVRTRIWSNYKAFCSENELEIAMSELDVLCETASVTCLRAFLLHALSLDPDFVEPYASGCQRSCEMLLDLKSRILPIMFPIYMDAMCQNPHEFVRTCVVLHEMWKGEGLEQLCVPRKVNKAMLTNTSP